MKLIGAIALTAFVAGFNPHLRVVGDEIRFTKGIGITSLVSIHISELSEMKLKVLYLRKVAKVSIHISELSEMK